MTITADQFRADFSEFADPDAYADGDISFYLNLAGLLLNADRWGRLLDMGTELFIAHNLVLEYKAKQESANGAAPGLNTGVINNKAVDKVSVGYDTQAGIEVEAGHWNLTTYGTRFIRLVRMMGAGPVQVCGSFSPDPLSSANAWYGPLGSGVIN